MISIIRYDENMKNQWNLFNASAKNPLFMFDRNFMDYHKDRFQDHSLLFYEDGKLLALFPANQNGNVLVSHGGLTYGGFVTGEKMRQQLMIDCLNALMSYGKENGFTKILYKSIPHIYHEQPAEEDQYALFLLGAKIAKIEASTVINMERSIKVSRGRKGHISRAKREGVTIRELTADCDFYEYIELVNQVLEVHHDTKAVHTGEELALLHQYFPNQIHLIGAFYKDNLIAGTVLFEYGQVVHGQYFAANDLAREIGALDLTIYSVIEHYKGEKKWFDFGISTENGGTVLNEGLIAQKEGFGGRTNVYMTFEIDLVR